MSSSIASQSTISLAWLLMVLLIALHQPSARAQVTLEQVGKALQTVNDDPQYAERRVALTERLQGVQNGLRALQEQEARMKELDRQAQDLPARLKSVVDETRHLQRAPQVRSAKEVEKLSPEALRQALDSTAGLVTQLHGELQRLNEEYQKQLGRPVQLRAELQALEAGGGTSTPVPTSEPGATEGELERRAREWSVEVQARLASARRALLEKELAAHPLQVDWLRAEMERSNQRLDGRMQDLKLLEERLALLRTREAEDTRQQMVLDDQRLEGLHPLVAELARRNLELSDLLVETSEKIANVSAATLQVNETMTSLGEDFDRTRQKIDVAGLSQALGQVLLEERRRLSAVSLADAQKLVSQKKIAEIGLRQIQHEEERQGLRSPRKAVEARLAGLPEGEAQSIRGQLSDLVEKRQGLLDRMVSADQSYLQAMSDLDFALRQVRDRIDVYRNFITERLLWIRSSQALDARLLGGVIDQIMVLADRTLLERLGKDLGRLLTTYWLPVVVGGLVVVVLLRRRRQFRANLERFAQPLRRLTTDNFLTTLKALGVSALLALPLSALLMMFGHLLTRIEGMGKLAMALGPALWDVGRVVFFLQLLRQMSRYDGILAAHFKWKDETVSRLRLGCLKLLYLFVPALLVASVIVNFDFGARTGALPHLAFAVSMVLLAYTLLALQPPPGALHAGPDGGLKGRVRSSSGKALRVVSVAGPLALALMGLLGYIYTASTLSMRLLDTAGFIVILVLVHQLVLRWLLLTERQLAYQNALERRAAMRQKAAEVASEEISGVEAQFDVEEPKIDLEAVSKGGRELLNTVLVISGAVGVWVIWSEILPAFGILDQFALWQYTEKVGDEEVQIPVTIFDLGLAFFMLAVTLLATKRVPALLEFVLLQRLNLEAGGLYTIKTLSGYLIAAIGVLLTFSSVGASWSQIQWLAAALSVGIGFGLQEIVANFISGLIILFERPIRVGDVVTVGDTDGVVTRINIRATTIRNWDQKELLVPNKEFITGRLLNWTLSDQTTRLFIPFAVAYGTRVEEASAILLDIVRSVPNVMADPAPSVFFESLGDNALVLNVRCFVAKLEYRLPAISEIHTRAYNELGKVGISFAFPQRDLHLDTLAPLQVQITRQPRPSAGASG